MDDFDVLDFFKKFRANPEDRKREITNLSVQGIITKQQFIDKMKELKGD